VNSDNEGAAIELSQSEDTPKMVFFQFGGEREMVYEKLKT
jgi:hypothetical protein